MPLITILALFEVFDGLQVSLSGIFKGLKKTKTVLFASLVGYWFVAIPVGCVLAFKFWMSISGFWIGILSASVVLCLIMGLLLLRNIRKLEQN